MSGSTMGGEVLALLAAVLLLLGNAFFVCAEFSIITAGRDRLEGLAAAGVTRARIVLRAGERLPLLIAGAQLGITLCSLALGRLGEPAVAHLIERPFQLLGLPDAVLDPVAFTISLGIVVTLHTVIGEMVPKNLALVGPERAAVALVPVHYAFCRAASPLLWLFNVAAAAVLRLFGVVPRDELELAFTPDELAEMIADSRREGLLDDEESSRLSRTLSSATRIVADVVIPLDDVTTLPDEPTVRDMATALAETGYSRFPVARPDGRLVGYLHVKDVLDLADQPGAVIPRSRVRGLPQVRSDARLDDALAALRRSQAHLGKAVSPLGDTLGLVAMEDLLEYYVGTVRDATHR